MRISGLMYRSMLLPSSAWSLSHVRADVHSRCQEGLLFFTLKRYLHLPKEGDEAYKYGCCVPRATLVWISSSIHVTGSIKDTSKRKLLNSMMQSASSRKRRSTNNEHPALGLRRRSRPAPQFQLR